MKEAYLISRYWYLCPLDSYSKLRPSSIRAKFQNYNILALSLGDRYHLAGGSKLQNKEVFVGKRDKYRIKNCR